MKLYLKVASTFVVKEMSINIIISNCKIKLCALTNDVIKQLKMADCHINCHLICACQCFEYTECFQSLFKNKNNLKISQKTYNNFFSSSST